MPILKTDEGEKFVAIKIRDEIILKPLPNDPIAALQKLGEKLKGVSLEELKKEAYEAAMEEAGK